MRIRRYIESDKERLRYICKITAGPDFQKSEKRLEAAAIIYNDYFTENEADNIFVLADDNDEAVGYILSSTDYDKYRRLNKSIYLKKSAKCGFFAVLCITGSLYALSKIKDRPAHLHIDILPQYQHKGWGRVLIDAECENLKGKNIEYLSVNNISRKSPAYPFYISYGFREYRHLVGNNYSLSIRLRKV